MRIRDPGWKKFGSGIRDKHPGSTTLILTANASFIQRLEELRGLHLQQEHQGVPQRHPWQRLQLRRIGQSKHICVFFFSNLDEKMEKFSLFFTKSTTFISSKLKAFDSF
jgi:hypothetical protein